MSTKLKDSTDEKAAADSGLGKREAEDISRDSKTPFDKYFDKLNALVQQHDFLGAMLVVGIKSEEDSDKEGEKEEDED